MRQQANNNIFRGIDELEEYVLYYTAAIQVIQRATGQWWASIYPSLTRHNSHELRNKKTVCKKIHSPCLPHNYLVITHKWDAVPRARSDSLINTSSVSSQHFHRVNSYCQYMLSQGLLVITRIIIRVLQDVWESGSRIAACICRLTSPRICSVLIKRPWLPVALHKKGAKSRERWKRIYL